MHFPIFVEKGSDKTAYGVIIPDLPGCFSAGDTFEEAVENSKEAITLYLETLAEDNQEISITSCAEKYIHQEEYKDMVIVMVNIDITRAVLSKNITM